MRASALLRLVVLSSATRTGTEHGKAGQKESLDADAVQQEVKRIGALGKQPRAASLFEADDVRRQGAQRWNVVANPPPERRNIELRLAKHKAQHTPGLQGLGR